MCFQTLVLARACHALTLPVDGVQTGYRLMRIRCQNCTGLTRLNGPWLHFFVAVMCLEKRKLWLCGFEMVGRICKNVYPRVVPNLMMARIGVDPAAWPWLLLFGPVYSGVLDPGPGGGLNPRARASGVSELKLLPSFRR